VVAQTDSRTLGQFPSLSRLMRVLYEKVIKVKADVAALLMFDLRHISTEKFALGSLRSDDRQFGRPTASPLLFVFSRNLASFLPCCTASQRSSQSSSERSETQFSEASFLS
jgi:hypothetical protein